MASRRKIPSLGLHRKSVSIKIHETHGGKDFPRVVHDKKLKLETHKNDFPRVIHTKGKIPSVM